MSLPIIAEVSVNCIPASCMPSPESPAKRTVTDGSLCVGFFSTLLVGMLDGVLGVSVLIADVSISCWPHSRVGHQRPPECGVVHDYMLLHAHGSRVRAKRRTSAAMKHVYQQWRRY